MKGVELLFDVRCLEANFGSPQIDVYDSLDVGRQGDLAHCTGRREGGRAAIAGEKIAPTYGEFTAFTQDEQHWHAIPHHPLVPPPTSGLPSPSPCKAVACFLAFPKMLSCNLTLLL